VLSSQEEQTERRRVFAQDQSLRDQATTFHQHAVADADIPRGRFAAVDAAYVVGSKADVASAYPAASAHQADPCGPEPPLGYRIDDLNLSDPGSDDTQAGPPPAGPDTGPTLAAPSTPLRGASVGPLSSQPNPASVALLNCSEGVARRGVGLGLSSGDTAREFPSPPGTSSRREAVSLPIMKRRRL